MAGPPPVSARKTSSSVGRSGDAFTAMVAAAQYWGLDWVESVRWGQPPDHGR